MCISNILIPISQIILLFYINYVDKDDKKGIIISISFIRIIILCLLVIVYISNSLSFSYYANPFNIVEVPNDLKNIISFSKKQVNKNKVIPSDKYKSIVNIKNNKINNYAKENTDNVNKGSINSSRLKIKKFEIDNFKKNSDKLINNNNNKKTEAINKQRRKSFIQEQLSNFKLLDAGKIVIPSQMILNTHEKNSSNILNTINKSPMLLDINNYYTTNEDFVKISNNNKSYDINKNNDNSVYDNSTVNSNVKYNNKIKEVVKELNRISDYDFDVFNLHNNSDNFELLILMTHLYRINFNNSNLQYNVDKFSNYFHNANTRYKNNPYHNSIHATDVTQTFYFLIKTCNVGLISNLTDLELFSCLFSAAIHDLEHPGNNNGFEIATNSELSLSYNDKSVLENYHLFKAFYLLEDTQCNFVINFKKEDYIKFRQIVIQCVLATDMEMHGPNLIHLNSIISLDRNKEVDNFDPSNQNNKEFLMTQLIHASDVSNPIKPFKIYNNWVNRVLKEFFDQGDKEKELGLPVSYLCDRNTVTIPDSQLGFIKFIVYPLFNSLSDVYPNIKMILSLIKSNEEEFLKLKNKNNSN